METAIDSAEFFRLNEPFNVRGNVWEVASVSPDGLHIALRRSKANVPIKPYLDVGYPALEFSGEGLDGQADRSERRGGQEPVRAVGLLGVVVRPLPRRVSHAPPRLRPI